MTFNYFSTTFALLMYKVQLTFTPEEASILSNKAQQLGYGVAKFIKLLIGREVLTHVEQYPTFPMSKKTLAKVKKAQRDHEQGKTVLLSKMSDLDRL